MKARLLCLSQRLQFFEAFVKLQPVFLKFYVLVLSNFDLDNNDNDKSNFCTGFIYQCSNALLSPEPSSKDFHFHQRKLDKSISMLLMVFG